MKRKVHSDQFEEPVPKKLRTPPKNQSDYAERKKKKVDLHFSTGNCQGQSLQKTETPDWNNRITKWDKKRDHQFSKIKLKNKNSAHILTGIESSVSLVKPSTESSDGKTADSKPENRWKRRRMHRKMAGLKKQGHVEEKTSEKNILETIIPPPKTLNEFSSNWKKFQTTLAAAEEKKKEKKDKDGKKKINKMTKSEPKKSGQIQKKTSGSTSQEKKTEEAAPDIWFDDVDDFLIEKKPGQMKSSTRETTNPLVKQDSFDGLTKAVGMDCEMVGIGDGGCENMLARVSIVNQHGKCVYDKYAKPQEKVVDYRTHVSGVTRKHLTHAEKFSIIQQEVSDILEGRLLVGHALENDLKVLLLSHPRKKIRDTAYFKPFRQLFQGKTPSLKNLTEKILGVRIQTGEHDSVQDAQAAMRLYTTYRTKWEKEIILKRRTGIPKKKEVKT